MLMNLQAAKNNDDIVTVKPRVERSVAGDYQTQRLINDSIAELGEKFTKSDLVAKSHEIRDRDNIALTTQRAYDENGYRSACDALDRDGNYPAGLSKCFIAGITGTVEQFNGICPWWGTPECTCDDIEDVFIEILESMHLTKQQWMSMTQEKRIQVCDDYQE